jgi:hypothetical protein
MDDKNDICPSLLDARRVNGYKRAMPHDPNELAKYRAALDALQVAVAHGGDASDAADIDKAYAALGRMCRRREGQLAQSKEVPVPAPAPAPAPASMPYAGLSVSEAAAKYLLSAGSAQRASKIVEALTSAGFEMTAERPVASLKVALERRSKNFGDVLLVAYGTWTHRENLTDKERAALEHKAQTKRGLMAARERGKQVGARLRLTPEIEAEMEKLLADGCKLKEVAAKFGFAQPTIRLRFGTERLRALRQRAKENKDRPNLRVVGGSAEAIA